MRDEKQSSIGLLFDWITRRGPSVIFMRIAMQIARIVLGRPIYRYSRILPGVYVGGQHRQRGLPSMQAQGITAVVNLRRSDDRARGVALERYLHLPTTDNTAPSVDALHEGVQFIAAEVAAGGSVYVHCGVGVGRAPTLTAAYLISTGMTPLQAWKHIRSIRPFIWPLRGQYRIIEEYARVYGAVEDAPLGTDESPDVDRPPERTTK